MNHSLRPRIFVSYSHAGNGPEWKAALQESLSVFEDQHLLDLWQDGIIRISQFWDDDINDAMQSADLAVVLLTPEALASDYIVNHEFPVLQQRQKEDQLPVIPVICESCDWKDHDWIRATQAPNASNPISDLSKEQQNRVFRALATEIAEKLSETALQRTSSNPLDSSTTQTDLTRFPIAQTPGLIEEKLIGRDAEVALLDLAFSQPETAIASLVAWGGVGKSMLVKHWLRRLERNSWLGMQRVYAWNFFSQGTTEDRHGADDLFLAEALHWFGVECDPAVSSWEKGRELAEAVSSQPTLLILDGIEPLQYPPGPMGGQLRAAGVQSLLKHLARRATNGNSSGFCLITTREPLTDLADFQRFESSSWGSVLRVDLGNLSDNAGAALLHHAGTNRAGAAEIESDDRELLEASREVAGHALTLNLLGRYLARAHNGDIKHRHQITFVDADRDEQGGTTFKMLNVFENWFMSSGEFGGRQLAILRILGLFDQPADDVCIGAIRNPPQIEGLTDPLFISQIDPSGKQQVKEPLSEQDWNVAVSFLADFGLVIRMNNGGGRHLLDCHPLIRDYFSQRFQGQNFENWQRAHKRLFDCLIEESKDVPSPKLSELLPLYQAVTHGCLAGNHEVVRLEVFWKRILKMERQYSWRALGAWSQDLAALALFFDKPWGKPAESLPDYSKALVFGQAATCLISLGRLQDALDPLKKSQQLMRDLGQWKQAAAALSNLSVLQQSLGNLEDSWAAAEMALECLQQDRTQGMLSNNSYMTITCLAQAAHCYFQCRESMTAISRFQEAENIAKRGFGITSMAQFLIGTNGAHYCDAIMSVLEEYAWASHITCPGKTVMSDDQRASMLSVRQELEGRTQLSQQHLNEKSDPHTNALDCLTLARTALICAVLQSEPSLSSQSNPDPMGRPDIAKPDILQARIHLDEAITLLYSANQLHLIPAGLLVQSWLCYCEGKPVESLEALNEAWDIAVRGPMRLHIADIHLHRARLFFREEHYPWDSPKADLDAAEKLINECGYHRRDQELADAKHAILGTS